MRGGGRKAAAPLSFSPLRRMCTFLLSRKTTPRPIFGVMTALTTLSARRPANSIEVGSLARQAANLDVSAFGDLYRLYAPQVLRYVSSRVSGAQEAEDIANTVFEKAFAAIGRYEPSPAQFSTWLYTIAQHTIIDHYRKRRLPQVDDAELELFAVTDPSEGPEGKLLADERHATVHKAVMQLTEEQRIVIGCRFYFNLSVHEVAMMIGKSEGAVKALQFRALDRLRRMLAPEWARS